jgi:hypothetical protein
MSDLTFGLFVRGHAGDETTRMKSAGYTILVSNASTMTTNHLLYKDMKYIRRST